MYNSGSRIISLHSKLTCSMGTSQYNRLYNTLSNIRFMLVMVRQAIFLEQQGLVHLHSNLYSNLYINLHISLDIRQHSSQCQQQLVINSLHITFINIRFLEHLELVHPSIIASRF